MDEPLRVVVLGASGNVGHGAARAWLDAGAEVLAPTRTEAGAEAIRRELPGDRLVPLVADVSDPVGAQRLATRIAEAGPIAHVFASLGPWWQGGRTAGQPPEAWLRVRAMMLDGHVLAATQLIPLLEAAGGGSYTVVTGAGAHALPPGAGLMITALGGVLKLSEVLRAEHRDGAVRVHELHIRARVEKLPRPGVIPADELGRFAVALAQGGRRSEVVPFPASRA